MPTAFDLKALASTVYRLTLDPSADIVGQTTAERAWLYRIPCKYGHIYVHGSNLLGGYTDRRMMKSRLLAVPGVTPHQVGDTEASVTFPPEAFPSVADLLQARRRRQYSEATKATNVRRLAEWRATQAEANSPKHGTSATAPDESPPSP